MPAAFLFLPFVAFFGFGLFANKPERADDQKGYVTVGQSGSRNVRWAIVDSRGADAVMGSSVGVGRTFHLKSGFIRWIVTPDPGGSACCVPLTSPGVSVNLIPLKKKKCNQK